MERSSGAFRRLYVLHHRAVYAYCLRRVDPDDAVDAAAEVFLTAWRCMDEIPDGEAALAWLFAVARRRVSRHKRGQMRRHRLGLRARSQVNPAAESPERVVVRGEEYTLALQALRSLRAPDQEILMLAAWDERPHSEIAGLLGCSVNAVDQRLHRARRRLASKYRKLAHHHHVEKAPLPRIEEGEQV